jgi:hypothetical protein
MSVDLAATRCAYCTSMLEPLAVSGGARAGA